MTRRPEEPITQYDLVGRRVENAFGKRETIVMQRGRWDYLYWLGSIGLDIRSWIKDCDLQRGDMPLGEALSNWIWWTYENRQREGKLQPSWLKEPAEADPKE